MITFTKMGKTVGMSVLGLEFGIKKVQVWTHYMTPFDKHGYVKYAVGKRKVMNFHIPIISGSSGILYIPSPVP